MFILVLTVEKPGHPAIHKSLHCKIKHIKNSSSGLSVRSNEINEMNILHMELSQYLNLVM